MAALLAGITLGAAPAPAAHAGGANFTVNDASDVIDAIPGNGVCETVTGSGICTLRAAIQETNALAGPDTITLPAGTYTLSIAGAGENLSATGDLDINGSLTINGAGSGSTTINAGGLDRALDISTTVVAQITGVTITGGNTTTDGGGIQLSAGASLTLVSSAVISNTATSFGGGIHNNGGTLALDATTVANNTSSGAGGGIRNQASGATSLINGSVVSGNTAPSSNGGGISNSSGTVTVTNSTIGSGNSALSGGGIAQTAGTTVSLVGSTVISNTATTGSGGGVINTGGTLTVNGSDVTDNTAAIQGGGLRNDGGGTTTISNGSLINLNDAPNGGGVSNSNGAVHVVDTTVMSNTASTGDGGGLRNDSTTAAVTLAITNTLIYTNVAGSNGGGIQSGGVNSATLTIVNSTLSANQAFGTAGGVQNSTLTGTIALANVTITGNFTGAGGSGLRNAGSGNATVKNSIIALSGNGPNCSTGDTITSQGFNLENTNTCDFTGTGDLFNVIPTLGALQDNGGPTLTHALLTGSRGIDEGDNVVGCTDTSGALLTTDQRGFARPVGARCDIGAYESNPADMSVTKSDSPDPAANGAPLTYTVVITNNGPAVSSGSVFTDILPASVTFASAPAGCGNFTNVVTCSVPSLASGASMSFAIVVTPTATGVITNTVTVDGIEVDPTPGNDTAVAVTTVLPAADLSVSKSDSPDPVVINQPLTYTVTLTNNGPDNSTGSTVTDTLPAGVTFGSASGGCSEAGGVVTCAIGALANGANTSVTIVVTPTVTGVITNTAVVDGNQADGNAANDSDSEETTVVPVPVDADLSLSKSDSPDPALVGQPLTYTLTVTNNGPDASTGSVVTDTLPAGVTFDSATAGCTNASGTVTCAISSLLNGGSASVNIVVIPTASGALTNTAVVDGNENDPNTANDSASASTTVSVPTADLGVSKSASSSTAVVGQPLTYTVTITNNGPDGSTGSTVTDTLPAGVTFGSASAGCSEAGGVVTCAIGALANGANTSVDIVVTPDAAGTITNTVTVVGDDDDPNAANDNASVSTTVNAAGTVTDLSIDKTANAATATGSNTITYTITVSNNGAAVNGAAVTDLFPAEVTAVSWTCSASSGSSCSAGAGSGDITALSLNLLDGGAATIVATGTIASGVSGDVTNTASVSAPTGVTDSDPSNNSDDAVVTVTPSYRLYLPMIQKLP
jgi:uncharacterized repeat protein (TIGR01451 family)